MKAAYRRTPCHPHFSGVPGAASDLHLLFKLYEVSLSEAWKPSHSDGRDSILLRRLAPATLVLRFPSFSCSPDCQGKRWAGPFKKKKCHFTMLLRLLHPTHDHSPHSSEAPTPRPSILHPPIPDFGLATLLPFHYSTPPPPASYLVPKPRLPPASAWDSHTPQHFHSSLLPHERPQTSAPVLVPLPHSRDCQHLGKEGRRLGGVAGGVPPPPPPPGSPLSAALVDPGSVPRRARGSEAPSPTHPLRRRSTSLGAGPRAGETRGRASRHSRQGAGRGLRGGRSGALGVAGPRRDDAQAGRGHGGRGGA